MVSKILEIYLKRDIEVIFREKIFVINLFFCFIVLEVKLFKLIC